MINSRNKYIWFTIFLLIISAVSLTFNIVQQVHMNQQEERIQHYQDNYLVMTNYLARTGETEQAIQSINQLVTQIENNNVKESTVDMTQEDVSEWGKWSTHFILTLQDTASTDSIGWYWTPELQTAHLNEKQQKIYNTLIQISFYGNPHIKRAANNENTEKLKSLEQAFIHFHDTLYYNTDRTFNPNNLDKSQILQTFEKAISELDTLLDEESFTEESQR